MFCLLFLTDFFYSQVTFYTKYFVVSYSIDVVATNTNFLENDQSILMHNNFSFVSHAKLQLNM